MSGTVKAVLVVVLVAAAGVVTWYVWPKGKQAPPPEPPKQPQAATKGTEEARASDANNGQTPVRAVLATTQPYEATRMTPAEAQAAYKRGKTLMGAKDLVEARLQLSRALASGHLKAAEEADAVEMLCELADEIIFSRKIIDGDPYAVSYIAQSGDSFAGLPPKGIERRLGLHVPWQLLLRINGLSSGSGLMAGKTVKLLYGPFHAIVTKSKFTMDVYLGDVFVKRYKVGIGAPDSFTPAGYFQVSLGGKIPRAPYTAPNSTSRAVHPDDPGYPLDPGGHWISLTGIREKGTDIPRTGGYGIHGTNDPSSIGKMVSHGCVRLSAADIKEVFSLLYEEWSMVWIRE
jgi:hypothetical protein